MSGCSEIFNHNSSASINTSSTANPVISKDSYNSFQKNYESISMSCFSNSEGSLGILNENDEFMT